MHGCCASCHSISSAVELSDLSLVLFLDFFMLEGGEKYQIKGCAGQGGFAQVFKAYVNSNPDNIVALKVIIIWHTTCKIDFNLVRFTPSCLKLLILDRFKSRHFLGNSICTASLTFGFLKSK